jgi:hypothetical protein
MAPRLCTLAALIAVCLGGHGCMRTYVPTSPKRTQVSGATVTLDELRVVALPQSPITASLRLSAPAGTELVDARLAPPTSTPCASGVGPLASSEGDELQTAGPLKVDGAHELELIFPADALKERHDGSALDLWLVRKGEASCVRFAIADAESGSAGWQLAPTSAGIWLDVGLNTFATFGDLSGEDPRWLIFERIGAVFGEHRAWAEIQGGADSGSTRGLLLLGLGIDRRLWNSGRWGFRMGAGYNVALTTRFNEDGPATREHLLHGPRIQPSLTFALLSPTGPLGLPVGDRTVHLHLDAPLALWFGFAGGPPMVFAAGAGLGASLAF